MKKLIGLNDIKYELEQLKQVPHIIFSGPRGTGKTTLAQFIANNKNKKLVFTTGNTLKKNEVLNVLINLEEGDIFLIDEIHRLRADVEEILYQPMENFRLPIKDVSGRFQVFPLPNFALIGTTTKPSKISKPLMSRFRLALQIPHYNVRELALIILDQHNISRRDALNIALHVITPREALNLAYRVLQLKNNVDKNLAFIGYKYGLSKAERFYLKIVYNVGKISLSSLCSALQLDEDEIKFVEDRLIRKRLVQITSKGRQLTIDGMLKIRKMQGK